MKECETKTKNIALGLWGNNGHQIHGAIERYPQLKLIAFGAFDDDTACDLQSRFPEAVACNTYEELLAVEGLEMASLCSPLRAEQAGHAIAALNAGINVYAEKPCATNEDDLDRILEAARCSSAVFHEMANTIFSQPYWAMKNILRDGIIGEVVQVSAQKSYPYHHGRPTSEAVDGGLVAQNGVHAMRFVEHITGLRATDIDAIVTSLGEEREGSDLKVASSMMGRLENEAVFSIVANYLNPAGFGSWGNEMVRLFGTEGMMESVDGGTGTRLVVGEEDRGELDISETPPDWLEAVIEDAMVGKPMPIDLETELHPTRMVLKAKAKSKYSVNPVTSSPPCPVSVE